MNTGLMADAVETERLVLFPFTRENLALFNDFGRRRGVRTVRADTLPDNVKSQNVLRRCGFRFLRADGNLWWEADLT